MTLGDSESFRGFKRNVDLAIWIQNDGAMNLSVIIMYSIVDSVVNVFYSSFTLGMIGCSFLTNLIILFYLRCIEYVYQNFILDLKPNVNAFGVELIIELSFKFNDAYGLEIFVRSWFRLTVLVVIPCTVEIKKVSTAKRFALDCKPFGNCR